MWRRIVTGLSFVLLGVVLGLLFASLWQAEDGFAVAVLNEARRLARSMPGIGAALLVSVAGTELLLLPSFRKVLLRTQGSPRKALREVSGLGLGATAVLGASGLAAYGAQGAVSGFGTGWSTLPVLLLGTGLGAAVLVGYTITAWLLPKKRSSQRS